MAFQLQYKDDSPDIIADRARMGTEVRESFFDLYSEDLKEASKVLALAFAGERRVFLCGTGSCYAVAALLQGRFINPPQAARGPLPAALLSARPMGNPDPLAEAGGTRIFARQIEAFGGDGDVLVLFTPDGNGSSPRGGRPHGEGTGHVHARRERGRRRPARRRRPSGHRTESPEH